MQQYIHLQALGHAIGHSLWQLGAIWLVCHALSAVRGTRSPLKYTYAVLAAMAGMLLFVVTYLYQLHLLQSSSSPHAFFVATKLDHHLGVWNQAQVYYGTVVATLASLAPFLSGAYLLVVTMLLIRLANGFAYIGRLRQSGLQKAPAQVKLFVEVHAQRIGINRKVHVLVSQLVNSPLTIGFLKPMILLPVATLNQLSISQLEAVLMHELAHIKRHDYLINLLLQAAEILLFFNPFMRLLLKQARLEREHSCDDFVLQFEYNPADYARALLAVQQQTHASILALCSTGKDKFQLLSRIKRMVAPQRNTFDYWQQLRLLLLVTVLGIFATVVNAKLIRPKALQANDSTPTGFSNEFPILPIRSTYPTLDFPNVPQPIVASTSTSTVPTNIAIKPKSTSKSIPLPSSPAQALPALSAQSAAGNSSYPTSQQHLENRNQPQLSAGTELKTSIAGTGVVVEERWLRELAQLGFLEGNDAVWLKAHTAAIGQKDKSNPQLSTGKTTTKLNLSLPQELLKQMGKPVFVKNELYAGTFQKSINTDSLQRILRKGMAAQKEAMADLQAQMQRLAVASRLYNSSKPRQISTRRNPELLWSKSVNFKQVLGSSKRADYNDSLVGKNELRVRGLSKNVLDSVFQASITIDGMTPEQWVVEHTTTEQQNTSATSHTEPGKGGTRRITISISDPSNTKQSRVVVIAITEDKQQNVRLERQKQVTFELKL
ncbi:MAG: M56 family metallopeptidase [Bacteroidetes bacterium]|nr:MAG: M56 family metallopeptidase [Bacteroidota bacterium]